MQITEIIAVGPGWNRVRMEDGSIYTLSGNYNWRSNNPGNIEYGPFAISQGAIGSGAVPAGRQRGFAIFPTYEQGRTAKEQLLFATDPYAGAERGGYAKGSIGSAIHRYAPSSENNTEMYIREVAGALGVDPNTKLSALSPEQRAVMLDAMEVVEGYKVGDIFNAQGVRLPPAEIPNVVGTKTDTTPPSVAQRVNQMWDEAPPIPEPRSAGTAARALATFKAPRPVAKPGSIAAQQAENAAKSQPRPLQQAERARARAELSATPQTFAGQEGAPVARLADTAARAANPGRQVTAAELAAAHQGQPWTEADGPMVRTNWSGTGAQQALDSAGGIGEEGQPEAGMPATSAPVPRPASERPGPPPQAEPAARRLLPVIGPTGQERMDPVGRMPERGLVSGMRSVQSVPQRLVGEEATAAPTAAMTATKTPVTTRIANADPTATAGNVAMPKGARPQVADSLVASAEAASRDQQRRTQLERQGMSYAGQDRAVGLAPQKAPATGTGARARMDPVGIMPDRDSFKQEMGLPGYMNNVPSIAEMERRQAEAGGKAAGVAARANALFDAGATAKSAADVPKYITTKERVPIKTYAGDQKPVASSTQYTDGRIPLGETLNLKSRDAVAQAEAGRKAAEDIQYRTVTRTILNPAYVEQQASQVAAQPAKRAAAPTAPVSGAAPTAPQKAGDLNPLQRIRQAVGLPVDGLGGGIVKSVGEGLGSMFGLNRSGPNAFIGAAPKVIEGRDGSGTQAVAINRDGSRDVTLSGGDSAFDRDNHQGQNMDVYRANREATGGVITQQSIDKAVEDGKTVYRAR